MARGQKNRRNRDSGAVLIIVISALVMVMCMVLFFASAMRQAEKPASPQGNEKQTEAEITPVDRDETPVSQGSASAGNPAAPEKQTETPPAPPAQTERITEKVTERITEKAPEKATEKVTEKVTEQKPPKSDPPPVIPEYNDAILAKVALPEGTAPAGYVDKLVFFGDSTTYGMKPYKVFGSRDTTQVWTPTSGTLALFRAMTDLIYNPVTGEEQLIGDLAASVKPEYLIMTLGVNGVAFMDEAYFKAEYQNVVEAIRKNSPDTKLILQSIYPIAKSYENQNSINNKKICDANKWIVEIADAYGLPYLNTYSALVNADGYLPENFQNGDGMHMNELGFAAIMDYVKSHPCT